MLRAKGAETRGLVPFGVLLADEVHSQCDSAHSRNVRSLLLFLQSFYKMLGAENWDAEAAANACRQFCLTLKALHLEAMAAGKDFWPLNGRLTTFGKLISAKPLLPV